MKMKLKYLIVFILLFLVGCGQNTVFVCSDGSHVEDATVCTDITEAEEQEEIQTEVPIESSAVEEDFVEEMVSEQSYILSESEKALLNQRFTASTRAVLSTPIVKNLHAGDVYVAGLGIRNILGAASRGFIVDITFREAKDFSNSVLQTDDDLIQAWLDKNLFTTYTLQRSEEITLPIIIEVGDYLTDKGDPVVPGTYIYDVRIGYVTSSGSTDEYQNLVLTVQVVE